MSPIESLSRAELQKKAQESQWFHAIDFGDFSTSGRFPDGTPQNLTLYGAMEFLSKIDLNGKVALDIGSSDGLASFGMSAFGAQRVVSIDSFDLPTYRIARKLLDIETDYRPRVQIKDAVQALGWKQFDAILCAGVIYHMLNPMSAFVECRKLLKDNGLLIMESPIAPDTDDPVLVLNTEWKDFLPEPSSYWIPSRSAMIGMMKLVGIDVIATRFLTAPTRLTVLGRAVEPADVNDRSDILKKVHEIDFCDFEFRFKDLDQHKGQSTIEVPQLQRHRDIDPMKEQVDFPFQPQAESSGVGRTRWKTVRGNYD